MGKECGDAVSENGSVGRRCGLLECVNGEAFDLGGAWPEDVLGRVNEKGRDIRGPTNVKRYCLGGRAMEEAWLVYYSREVAF